MGIDSNIDVAKRDTTGRWLLVSLVLSLLVLPLFEGLRVGRALLLVGYSLTFVVGAIAAGTKLRISAVWISAVRIGAVVLLVMALPISWATLFVDSTSLFVVHCLLGSVFFWLVGGVIVFFVIKTRVITFDSVLNAISAYLLFGLAWAFSYWAIHIVSPDSFSIPGGVATGGADGSKIIEFSPFAYYSFVTMTTLGFGDFTPFSRITRTLSWMQSVVGQFYVAVMIAWLVSALPRPGDEAK